MIRKVHITKAIATLSVLRILKEFIPITQLCGMFPEIFPCIFESIWMDYKTWVATVLLSLFTAAKAISFDISDIIPTSCQGTQSDTQQTREGWRCSKTRGEEVKFPRLEKNVRWGEGEGVSKTLASLIAEGPHVRVYICPLHSQSVLRLKPPFSPSCLQRSTCSCTWPLPMNTKHAVSFRLVVVEKNMSKAE